MSQRFLKGAAALSLFVLAAIATRGFTRHLAEARVEWFLSTHASLRVVGVSAGPLADEVFLQGVSSRAGHARIAIGRLRLAVAGPLHWLEPSPALAEPAEPPASASAPMAGTIRADDVVLTVGMTTIRIKRIDIAGTKLTNADLAGLLDPKSSDSLESRLQRLSATAVVIPEMAIDDATPGSERHARLRQILLANIASGKATAVSAAEASIALSDGQAVVNGTTGGIEAAGVDLVQVAHVIRAPRKSDAEPIRPLLAKAVINAPQFTSATQDAGLAAVSVAVTSVNGRPLASTPPIADAATLNPAAAWLSDLATSFSIGTLDIDGFGSHSKPAGEETRIAAAHARLDALGDGEVGGMSLRGFRLEGPYAKLTAGEATVGAFQIRPPAGNGGLTARPGKLEFGQISVEVIPRDKGTTAVPTRFAIDHIAIAQSGGASTIPTSGSATVSNLGFDLSPESTLTHTLYDMGYHHVTLAATFTSSYDVNRQELTVNRLSVDEPQMGSIALALRLANVSQGLLSPDPETAQASAIAVLAKSVDLKLSNAGIFEKAIAFKAMQDGVSIADERTSGVDYFANSLPLLLGDGTGARAIGGAIAKFIADPKTLHISLASSDGLGVGAIGMLGDPGALLESLDVHASAND